MSNGTNTSTGRLLGFACAMLLAGLVIGVPVGMKWHASHSHAESSTADQLWTCGMHPQVIQNKPGNCPICGMALEPVKSGNTSGHAKGVTIDPVVVQNMGVRVAPATVGPVRRIIRAVGTLEEAQPNIRDINLRVSGWIEKLYADTEGMHVGPHHPLFELYSPEVQAALEELIGSRRALERLPENADAAARQSTQSVYDAARRKLDQWGLEADHIERMSKDKTAPRTVQISSPVAGHIVEKDVVEGAAVTAGQRVMRIVDHSTLWLDAQIHPQDYPFIKLEQQAIATIEGVPGEPFTGTTIFVHPHIDPMTRTARLRIAIGNPEMKLKPGMFATVQIVAELTPEAILIPRESVIDTGQRQIVFVASKTAGHFEPREVKLGSSGDDGNMQVLEGIEPGQQVVVSGQFLMDSESRMREAIQKHLDKQLIAKHGTAGHVANVTAAARQAVDTMTREYLAIVEKLGAMQVSDDPIDPTPLIAAAKSLQQAAAQDEAAKSQAQALVNSAENLKNKDILQQRMVFKAVSEAMITVAREITPSAAAAEKLYVWHCPMTDGWWLQSVDKPANPYYPDRMKECAELKETIATVK